MHVLIDGVQFVRWDSIPAAPSKWQLTEDHLQSAKNWPEWLECLSWAITAEATVDEMIAWRRAMYGNGTPVATGTPKRVEPLPVPGRKPKATLFDNHQERD